MVCVRVVLVKLFVLLTFGDGAISLVTLSLVRSMVKTFRCREHPVGCVALGYPPILERLLRNRGIKHPDDIALGLRTLLPPTGLMGLAEACTVLYEALCNAKRILIIGDYDVDGATATAVMYRGLRLCGFTRVGYLIPNRFEDGYGLSAAIVKQACALEKRPDIIITVDNGISSIEGVAFAKSQGLSVIVTDHHLPGDNLPDADAIVNPQCCHDSFASSNLAGVGVAFYLCIALRAYLQKQDYFAKQSIALPHMASLLDLVALGTIADLVVLDKNNRILAYQGLARIRTGKCVHGLRALCSLAKIPLSTLSSEDIAFRVAPKLNAAGRMDDMRIGVACLLADDYDTAYRFANQLVTFNNDRRQVQQDMYDKAYRMVQNVDDNCRGVSLYDAAWHQGVIGILASRIKEICYKPVIVFAPGDNNEIKGSARSIEGVNIRELLAGVAQRNPGLLTKFGGHAMAAGLSLLKDDLEKFRHAFAEVCDDICATCFTEQVIHDGPLAAAELTLDTAKQIAEFGVWGQGFSQPLFVNSFRIMSKRLLKAKHILLDLQLDERPYRAVWFNAARHYDALAEGVNVALCYRLSVSEYLGVERLDILINDVVTHASQLEEVAEV